MTDGARFGTGLLLADTSAWARAGEPAVAEAWIEALRGGRIVTFPMVVLELLQSARDAGDLERREGDLARLRLLPLRQTVARAAVGAMHDLAARGAGQHRVPPADLLIASAAQEAGAAVLHYDRHYDRLAEVLSVESRWIAPAGSL